MASVYTAVGLMSGTSVDGIDAALVRIEMDNMNIKDTKLLAYLERSIPAELKQRIKNVMSAGTAEEICQLNVVIGEEFAKAALQVMELGKLSASQVDFIGSHGQTIYHIPKCDESRGWSTPSTLQIGDPCVIAEVTGITTVADFRLRDMAAGGTGAPLIPFVDIVLARNAELNDDICFQNIGGIGNCTFISKESVVAFDTGPGNMIMDLIIQRHGRNYDRNGEIAASGEILPKLLEKTVSMGYFSEPPPKCTGHELFGKAFVEKFIQDGLEEAGGMLTEKECLSRLLATATEITAISISQSYRQFLPQLPKAAIISGGGAKNEYLMKRIQHHCGEYIRVMTSDQATRIPSDAKEAVGFAMLAMATLCGIPSNIPAVTGARGPRVLGKIVPGGESAKLVITHNIKF